MLAFVPKLSKRNIVKKSVRGEQENNPFAGDFLPVVLDFFFSFWGVGVGVKQQTDINDNKRKLAAYLV